LTRRGYAPQEIAAVIARLTEARYLDDADFARTWVSMRARRGAAAPTRLARELRTKGIAAGEIAAALRALQEEWDPAEAAGEAAKRKLNHCRGCPHRWRGAAWRLSWIGEVSVRRSSCPPVGDTSPTQSTRNETGQPQKADALPGATNVTGN